MGTNFPKRQDTLVNLQQLSVEQVHSLPECGAYQQFPGCLGSLMTPNGIDFSLLERVN